MNCTSLTFGGRKPQKLFTDVKTRFDLIMGHSTQTFLGECLTRYMLLPFAKFITLPIPVTMAAKQVKQKKAFTEQDKNPLLNRMIIE